MLVTESVVISRVLDWPTNMYDLIIDTSASDLWIYIALVRWCVNTITFDWFWIFYWFEKKSFNRFCSLISLGWLLDPSLNISSSLENSSLSTIYFKKGIACPVLSSFFYLNFLRKHINDSYPCSFRVFLPSTRYFKILKEAYINPMSFRSSLYLS